MRTWVRNSLIVGGVYFSWTAVNHLAVKHQAFAQALALTGSKGILNLGCGANKPASQWIMDDPHVVENVDVKPDAVHPVTILDLEQTPYPFTDDQFDVVFCSHVLEHLTNWEACMSECQRIAGDSVFVLPNPLSILSYVNREHKQHFSFSDIDKLRHSYNTFVFA